MAITTTVIDHSGYTGMNMKFTTAAMAARITPRSRAKMLPLSTPSPARTMITPQMRWIQPHWVMSRYMAPVLPQTTHVSLTIASSP